MKPIAETAGRFRLQKAQNKFKILAHFQRGKKRPSSHR
jgi:hypothetical protein